MRKSAAFIAISLVAAVISLASDARAAVYPTGIAKQANWTPTVGFGPSIGKLAKDADNLYAVDLERRGIVKMNPALGTSTFISTPAEYGRPYAVAVMNDGTMVVTFQYPKPKVVLLDQAGGVKATYAGSNLSTASFQAPVAVTLDSQENIYVLDAGYLNATVETIAPENYLYFAANTSEPCIHVFTKAGVAVPTSQNAVNYPTNTFASASSLSKPAINAGTGKVMLPEGITYDSGNQRIVVADTLNGRVQFFGAADGNATDKFKFVKTVGNMFSFSDPLHMTMPSGVAFEYDGTGTRMYVVDKVLMRVLVIDPATLQLLGTITPTTVAGVDLVYPRDLIFFKGSVLIASEQRDQSANLQTLTVPGYSWPPTSLPLTFDYAAAVVADANFPNVVVRAGNTFPITGTVESGATVTWLNNNGSAGSGSCNVVGTGYTCTVTLVAGDNVVRVHGEKGSATADVVVPTIHYTTSGTLTYDGPVIAFDTIVDTEKYRKTDSITVTGTVNYSGAGQNTSGADLTVQIYNDRTGQRVQAVVNTGAVGNLKPWSATVPLVANMANTLTPSAYTAESRRSTAAGQQVIVDTLPPIVDIASLEGGAVTLEQVQNIAGTAKDANLQSVYVDVNGAEEQVSFDLLNATSGISYFSGLALLNKNGLNTVRVRAVDKAGNVGTSVSHTMTLLPMKLAPLASNKIIINPGPANNLFYTNAGVALNYAGTVPAGTDTVSIGLGAATVTGGTSYACESTACLAEVVNYVKLVEQINPVVITATGSYGTISKSTSVYVNPAAPGVSISSRIATDPTTPEVVEDRAVNTKTISFSGAVTPSKDLPGTAIAQVDVKLTGPASVSTPTGIYYANATLPVTSGQFSTGNITLPADAPEGTYTLKVTATNGVGTTVATRNVAYDATKPSVGIALDYADLSVIRGYIEPGATMKVLYGAVGSETELPITIDALNPSLWSVTGNLANIDLLTVAATDVAGNTSSRKWQIAAPTGDSDADGVLRVSDVLQLLRLVVQEKYDVGTSLASADVAPIINGISAPDGLITIDDALLVLMKVEGKPW
jgi:sugar lactone lactonase YvrE